MSRSPAIFASAFHPYVGGVEELTRQLALEQLRRGDRPTVVTNRFPKDLPATEVHQGIDVVREPFRVPEPNLRQFGGWLVHGLRTERRLTSFLRDRGTDLVHVQCVSSNGRYALAAAARMAVPLVVTMQGELSMDATGVYQRSAQLRRSWRQLLERADVVTGCSRYVVEEAEAAFGQSLGDRSRVVYNGISLAEFAAVDAEQRPRSYVLGIGRMVHQKGFDVLLQAFEVVAQKVPDIELVLAGGGPAREALEAAAVASGVADRVTFLGSVDHTRAIALYKGSEAFVLPSRHEPQGIVVLEAMAAGTPVVASAVGGVPEVVRDGHNGLLFSGGSSDELAERLVSVLTEDSVADRLRAEGLATARQFDWAAIAEQYEACYAAAGAHFA